MRVRRPCAEEATADFEPRRFGRIMLLALAVTIARYNDGARAGAEAIRGGDGEVDLLQ